MSFIQPRQTHTVPLSLSLSIHIDNGNDEINPYVNKKDINKVFFVWLSAFVSRTIVSIISSSIFRMVCPSNKTVEEILLKGMKYCIEFSGKKNSPMNIEKDVIKLKKM